MKAFLFCVLLSSSWNFAYAEPQPKINTGALTRSKINNDTWLFKNISLNVALDSSYFYVAPGTPGYEGGGWIGMFVPFTLGHSKKHHLWLNTGNFIASGAGGYRYVLKQTYLGQNWFLGCYLTHAYHGEYKLGYDERGFRSVNYGAEVGTSKWGQWTINGYKFFTKGLDKPFNRIEAQPWYRVTFKGSKLIDRFGVSVKWVSIPKFWDVQVSAVGALTNVYSKMQQGAQSFSPEWVYRFGVGFEFNVSSWAHVDLTWILLEKYQPLSFVPSFNIKLMGVQPHLKKDAFQGRLKRPSQYYEPVYIFSETEASDVDLTKPISMRRVIRSDQGNIEDAFEEYTGNDKVSILIAEGEAVKPQPIRRAKNTNESRLKL